MVFAHFTQSTEASSSDENRRLLPATAQSDHGQQRARPRKPTANWRRRMYLHAEQLPLTHIMECFGDHYTVVDGSSERASQYDYCLEFTSEFPPGFEDMVQLLTDALCLPPEEPLDLALALDRYKVPDDDLPATAWANTEIGELVHRAKYYKSSPGLQEAARETLAERLAGAIQSHPAYWRAPYLVSVPGASGDGTSTGEIVARLVSQRTGKRLIQTVGPERPAKKANPSLDVRGMFQLPTMLDGPCVVVDDVWMTGATIREVGRVARGAGAPSVYGLAAARTMRN